MTAIQLNLYVEAGATFQRSLVYTNDDGSLFDLTGYTGQLQVRETVSSATAKLTVTPSINVETATISWSFTATQTSTLTASSYVYALELYGPDNYVIRLLEGSVVVSPEVVR
jgi:outer membrane protein assembly factor BamB